MARTEQLGARRHQQVMAIKYTHSLILVVMSAAVLYVLLCGVTGQRNLALWIAIGLVTLECLIFLVNRSRCPLTTLAIQLGDTTGNDYLSDRFLPQAWVRFTVPVCGGLFGLGLAALAFSTVVRVIR